MRRRSSDDAVFSWGVIGLVVTKLWLTSEIRIVPLWAPHDAENYVAHARAILAGAWFGQYDVFTLIKEPFYPIYLAAVQELGFPLPLANVLMYAAACAIACLAVRPIVRNGFVLLVLFAVLLYNPLTYATLAWLTMRSLLNDSLALLVASCALAILVRHRASFRALMTWWIGLGLSFAAFCLTREESIWLAPLLVVILGAYVVSIRKDPELQLKLFGLAIPFACWSLSQAGIARVNQHYYGWNVVVETKAPEFVSAYNSMARIDTGPHDERIAVPYASREIAYRVSPAARELEPTLEGPEGRGWIKMVCAYPVHICNDFAGSFFVWAFRDAVAQAGHYGSGTEARAFYLRLARELDAACDSGRIPCRPKAMTIFPNPTVSEVPEIAAEFWRGIQLETTFAAFSMGHGAAPLNPVLDDLYAFVVTSIDRDRRGVWGWLATDRPMKISVEGPSGEPLSIDGDLRSPSPDVAAALAKEGRGSWVARDARFSFTTTCTAACLIVATDAKGRETKIPLSTDHPDFASPHIIYHLDGIDPSPKTYDDQLKQSILVGIGLLYRSIVPLWAIAAATLVMLRAARAALRRRPSFPSVNDLLSVAAVAATGFLLLLLAALTVSYSAVFDAEYIGSSVPVMLFALGFAAAREGAVAYRFARARAWAPAAQRLAARPQQID